MSDRPTAGINGNHHREHAHDPEGALEDQGVSYLGDGDWDLPEGASIRSVGGDDWELTLEDGTKWDVWSED